MNQILVTEKLYITPEMKRKRKMYKIKFFLSIFLMLVLFSYYIYAENDRNNKVGIAEDILEQINNEEKYREETIENDYEKDNTIKNIIEDDIIIVSLDNDELEDVEEPMDSERIEEQRVEENIDKNHEEREEQNRNDVPIYQSNNGEKYHVDSTLKIPKLGIDYPVLAETSEELLKISLNKYWGHGPNEVGNYCIVGHNYANGKLFGKLSLMNIGDIAVLKDMKSGEEITYEAYNKFIVNPDDVSCTSQLTKGKKEITLITCKNYGTQRLVIKCREV